MAQETDGESARVYRRSSTGPQSRKERHMTKNEARGLLDVIVERARAQGRNPNADEKSRVDEILGRVGEFTKAQETRERVDRIGGLIKADDAAAATDAWGTIAKALVRTKSAAASGTKLDVEVPLAGILRKSVEGFPAAGEFDTSIQPGIAQLLADLRRAYQAFPKADPGVALSVSEFRQTGSRDVTGSIERGLSATTGKAELDVSIEAVSDDLRQMAVVISDVPNALLEAEGTLRGFLASEMALQLDQALDAHVLAAIAAANPTAGNTGATLPERLRHAKAAMNAKGANPRVALISPADAVALDLLTDDETPKAFPFGLTFVEHPDVTDPILIDPAVAGILYRGNLRVEADPYSGFKRNTTNLRAEFSALMVVRNADGLYRVGAAA
jgi:hypothetical protein